MRKSVEQVSREVLSKLAESSALPPPASSPESTVPGTPYDMYPPPPPSPMMAPPPEGFVPGTPTPVDSLQETAPTPPSPSLPTPEELEELYRKTVMSRALIGSGAGALAGGAAGGLLTRWHPAGLLGGAAALGLVGNRIGTSVGEHEALKKLEKQTGIPWTMPGKTPDIR